MTVIDHTPANRCASAPARAEVSPRPSSAAAGLPRHWSVVVGCVLALAAFLAYRPALHAPFILDDEASIAGNASAHGLWPLSRPLSPPREGGLTVEGRPILNLSLALNYAFAGPSPFAYRATNVALHVASGLLLFGLVRRTLRHVTREHVAADRASAFALVAAACWTLHPLQTASVTYIIQRAESLCGFFYLLTLYAFVRGAITTVDRTAATEWRRGAWWALSVVSCALGMGTKEVMASAPLLVLLYDRAFLAGDVRSALRARGWIHAALGLTWLVLGLLVFTGAGRSGTAGFHTGVSVLSYALTQCSAILLYLRLALWPDPLVFDYGTALTANLAEAPGAVIAILVLLGATVFAVWRHPRVGFLAAAFFALLAPSSSVIPVATQTMAEHRMYLPLAIVILGAGWLAHQRLGRGVLWLGAAAAIAAGGATAQRNAIYREPAAVWADTVKHRPENTRARNNLALLLRAHGDFSAALAHLDAALEREPGALAIRNNRANLLMDLGRHDEALAEIDVVLRAAPALAEAYDTKADILRAMNRRSEADTFYAHAISLKPSLRRSSSP